MNCVGSKCNLNKMPSCERKKEKTFFRALGYANRILNAAKLSGEELEMRLLSAFNDRAIVADVIEAISEEGE